MLKMVVLINILVGTMLTSIQDSLINLIFKRDSIYVKCLYFGTL